MTTAVRDATVTKILDEPIEAGRPKSAEGAAGTTTAAPTVVKRPRADEVELPGGE